MIKVFKRKLKAVSTLLFICLFASSAQAGLMEYDFDNVLPQDWVTFNNAKLENGELWIDTRGPQASVETHEFNLPGGTYAVTISFDFDTISNPDLPAQNTRWVEIEFSNDGGISWEVNRILQTAAAGNYSYEYLGTQTGQFRFVGKDKGGKTRYITIDNVKISTVPAPHALAIFGFGIIFLVARLRKQ